MIGERSINDHCLIALERAELHPIGDVSVRCRSTPQIPIGFGTIDDKVTAGQRVERVLSVLTVRTFCMRWRDHARYEHPRCDRRRTRPHNSSSWSHGCSTSGVSWRAGLSHAPSLVLFADLRSALHPATSTTTSLSRPPLRPPNRGLWRRHDSQPPAVPLHARCPQGRH